MDRRKYGYEAPIAHFAYGSTCLGHNSMGVADTRSTDENTMNRAHAIAALGTIRTAQAEKLVEAALLDNPLCGWLR
jgi:hypothetical protein